MLEVTVVLHSDVVVLFEGRESRPELTLPLTLPAVGRRASPDRAAGRTKPGVLQSQFYRPFLSSSKMIHLESILPSLSLSEELVT